MIQCNCSSGGSCHICKPDEWYKQETNKFIVWWRREGMNKEEKEKGNMGKEANAGMTRYDI